MACVQSGARGLVLASRYHKAARCAAAEAEWFLSTTDSWTRKYYDPKDLYCADRELFGG